MERGSSNITKDKLYKIHSKCVKTSPAIIQCFKGVMSVLELQYSINLFCYLDVYKLFLTCSFCCMKKNQLCHWDMLVSFSTSKTYSVKVIYFKSNSARFMNNFVLNYKCAFMGFLWLILKQNFFESTP